MAGVAVVAALRNAQIGLMGGLALSVRVERAPAHVLPTCIRSSRDPKPFKSSVEQTGSTLRTGSVHWLAHSHSWPSRSPEG